MPFNSLSVLVDPGVGSTTVSAGVAQFSFSHRIVDFADVQYARLLIGAQVTSPTGVGATVTYRVQYSLDDKASWADLISPSTPFGDVWSMAYGPWEEIAEPMRDGGEGWIRGGYSVSVDAAQSVYPFDLQYR